MTPPAIVPPPLRLEGIPSGRRAAILAAVTTSSEPPEAVVAWVELVRRFASFHRGRLRRVARRRFGAEAEAQLAWMARLLLEGGARYPERGAAPLDVACLDAALYSLDAATRRDATLAARAESAIAAARAWAVAGEQQPAGPASGCTFSHRPGRWRDEAGAAVPVVIFAPTPGSLNAVAVVELCRRLAVPVAGIVLRRFTPSRLRSEWRREGPRLLRKIRRKLLLGADEHPDRVDTSLSALIERLDPGARDLRRLARAMGAAVRQVDDFGEAAGDPAVTGRKVGLFTGGGILPAALLEAFDPGIVNVHTGHLPRYRGMDCVPVALLEARRASVGLTAHYMAPAIDCGDVLTRLSLDPGQYPTAGALGNALAGLMPLMLVDAALGIGSGRLRRTPQPLGGRLHYVMHRRLRPIVDDCLASRHARAEPPEPSPARRTLDAVCADLAR